MSIVGPRPQLVRDMVFMTSEQRKRHDVRGLLVGEFTQNEKWSVKGALMGECWYKD